MAKGVKTIGQYQWNGAEFPIRVSVDNGYFEIEVKTKDPLNPKLFTGEKLTDVKEKAKAFLEDQTELVWEPVIYLKGNRARAGELGFELRRYFRAKRGDGTLSWRVDDAPYNQEPKMAPAEPDAHEDMRYSTFIPYTKESWKLLRELEGQIWDLNETISEGIQARHVDALLELLKQGGLSSVLGNPKRWNLQRRPY